MFHENLFNAIDRLQVYASTNGTDYTQIQAGALTDILRYDWSLTTEDYSVTAWPAHYIDLSQYSGTSTVWLKIRAISAGETGGNVIIDNMQITYY